MQEKQRKYYCISLLILCINHIYYLFQLFNSFFRCSIYYYCNVYIFFSLQAVVSSTQSEIAKLASGSILLLCVDLRQTYISDLGKDDESDSKLCNFLDSKYSSIEYKLTTILTNLIKWILSSGYYKYTYFVLSFFIIWNI